MNNPTVRNLYAHITSDELDELRAKVADHDRVVQDLKNEARLAGIAADIKIQDAIGRSANEYIAAALERDTLRAEVERLRQVLQAVYDCDYQAPHDATDAEISEAKKLCIFRMRKLARAALAGGKEGV